MEFGGIVSVPPRVLLMPVKCLMGPWKVKYFIVVLENAVRIIQIEVFGVKIEP